VATLLTAELVARGYDGWGAMATAPLFWILVRRHVV
jgi:hypothetical protein